MNVETAATRMPAFPDVVRGPRGARAGDLAALFETEGDELRERLLASGALLFRGFGVQTATELATLQAQMGEPMRYVGGDSPRTKLDSGPKHEIYTSTEAPPSVRLPLHNEMSYLDVQPRFLWLACAKAPARGGATVVADGRAIVAAVDPAVRERFEHHGVRYRAGFRGPGGLLAALDRIAKVNKSWMEAFETNDRSVVEEECRRRNARFEWSRAGHLTIETLRPATTRHPVTGELVWFNQAHVFRLNARYLGRVRYELARVLFAALGLVPHDASFGDGSPIPDDVINHLFDVFDAHTVPVRWEPGDVVLVDNILCMHGREPFHGERKILVAMNA
jgi:alpha-ketoglutarate-dependent taurine dioxygenase